MQLFDKNIQPKLLILGASGNMGLFFVDYLVNTLHYPKEKLILSSRHNLQYYQSLGLYFVPVDISVPEDFLLLPTDVDVVVDFAGLMPAKMEGYDPMRYIDVNAKGTLNVLNYCRNNGVKRIIYMQTFGDIKDNANENILLQPNAQRKFSMSNDHAVYVLSKNMAVDLIEHYHLLYGIDNIILRLPTVHTFSPVSTFFHNGVSKPIGYKYLIDRASKGEPIELWGNPNAVKDMVYVKDYCQMVYCAIVAGVKSGIYNVGIGIGTSLLKQIEGMIEVFSPHNRRSEIILRPDKPSAPSYIMDIENARRELGYEPQYSYLLMLEDIKRERILNRLFLE